MSAKTNLKSVLVAAIPKMVAGIAKHYAGQSLVLNNTAMTADELIARLNLLPAQVATAAATQTLAKTQLATADATAKDLAQLMSALHSTIRGRFGTANPSVEDFGMSPFKRGVRTVANKVEAIAKSLATRAERHTMGKRQKAAIHGTVAATGHPGGNQPTSGS